MPLTLWNSGASYTATGFNWKTGVQPSPSNPLGNPSSYKGHTATNGPNFVMYLTTKYNKSPIQTYDFAWGGAAVPGMASQVENEFVPYYTGNGKLDPGWNPAKTLFAIFVGINDLDSWGKGTSYRNNVFKQYSGAIDTVSNQMQLCTLNLAGRTYANILCVTSCTQLAPGTSSSTRCRRSTKAPSLRTSRRPRRRQSTTTTVVLQQC